MQPLLIFDKNNHTFTAPKVILKDYFSLTPSSVLGGEETLTFSIPATSFLFESEDYVLFENKRYVIKRHTKRRDDTGVSIEVSCEGLYTMLIDYYVDGEDTWLQGASMRTALERILRNTPFSVGRCDNFGTWDIELKELNCLEAINEVRDNWPQQAEMYFDGYVLNAVVVRGNDTAYQLHYNKNLVDIERIVDSAGVVTRLVGLGAEGLTIEGLSESEVANKDGVHISGGKVVAKYIDAPNIGDYSHPKMYYEDFSDIVNQKDLLEKMQSWLLQRYTPKLTYTVNFAEMLRQGVPYSDINIGDFVIINDPEFGAIKLRVVELSKDAFNIEHSTVTLGERYKTLEDYLGDFDASKDIWDSITNGELDSKLEAALNEAMQWLNNGQNTCFITENDGIICADRRTLGPDNSIQNNTRLIKMASGAIGCSVDGGQTYKSAMTPEGIVAESIIGGRIHSSHITVGDESLFEDGYTPSDIRKPIAVEFENFKDATGSTVGNMNKELDILNQAVSQTSTALDMLDEELRNKIDILSIDVSGLNGDVSTMEDMYNNVNNMLFGNSYFRWTKEGIHATDTSNTRYQMLLGAKGIGFSTNGGQYFTNAITAQGIVASQVNIGTFGSAPFKGLTIRNGAGQESFAIDTNGNLSLMGNINMQGGSIAWHNVSKVPYDALASDIKDKYTYIDSNGVYTGMVKTRQLELDGDFQVTKNGEPTFRISHDGSIFMRGSIHMDSNSTISWSDSNKPSLDLLGAAGEGDLNAFKDSVGPRLTNITSTGIYTGTIDAGKIVVTGPDSKIPKAAINITLDDLGGAPIDELNDWVDTMQGELGRLDTKIPTSQQITEITNNSIKTANISANQIIGGEIAGVQIYCDDKIVIGKKANSVEPRIIFAPDDEYTAITYKTNELGESYLGMQSDNGMSLFTKNAMKLTAQQVLDIRAPEILFNGVPYGQGGGTPGGGGSGPGGGDLITDANAYAKNYNMRVEENYMAKADGNMTLETLGTMLVKSGKSTNVFAGGTLNLAAGQANDSTLGGDININPGLNRFINMQGDIKMGTHKFVDRVNFDVLGANRIEGDILYAKKIYGYDSSQLQVKHTDISIDATELDKKGKFTVASNKVDIIGERGTRLSFYDSTAKLEADYVEFSTRFTDASPCFRWEEANPDFVAGGDISPTISKHIKMKDVVSKINEIAAKLGIPQL